VGILPQEADDSTSLPQTQIQRSGRINPKVIFESLQTIMMMIKQQTLLPSRQKKKRIGHASIYPCCKKKPTPPHLYIKAGNMPAATTNSPPTCTADAAPVYPAGGASSPPDVALGPLGM
jgi:hypothetical protein